MGKIDEKRLSGLLERIISIKEELGSLENEVREILTTGESAKVGEPTTPVTEPVAVTEPTTPVTEPTTPVTEPVEVTRQDALDASVASNASASSATEAPQYEETPIDDTPIDIDFANIDLPPIIEDPVATYDQAVTPAAEPSSVTEPVAVTEPVEVAGQSLSITEPSSVAEPVEVTGQDALNASVAELAEVTVETEPEDIQDAATDADAPVVSGASTLRQAQRTASSATEEAEEAATPVQGNDDLPFDDDLPLDIPEPESKPAAGTVTEAKPKTAILDSRKAETAVMDVMAEKQAWRTDRPGSQVKNVISAISLNDRVLLINVLFREDPILFQNTISAFNGMSSLDEALSYIQTNFPEWDMNSEPAYRLMMAVRRKLG